MKVLILMTKTPEHFGEILTTRRLNKRELDYHFYFKYYTQYILTQVLFMKLQEPTKNLELLIENTRKIKDKCVSEHIVANGDTLGENHASFSLLYFFDKDTDLSMFDTDYKTTKPFVIQTAGEGGKVIETEVFCVADDEETCTFLAKNS